MNEKLLAYIKACQTDDTDAMDKCLFAFTEKDLHIMNGGKPNMDNYKDTANPEWCMRFDCVNRWIYKLLPKKIQWGHRTEETELYFWYWLNV